VEERAAALVRADEDTCTRCGFCAAVCPAGLIVLKGEEYPSPVDGAEELCIACGHCVAVCPHESLLHRDLPLEDFPLMKPEYRMTEETVERFLRSRRSIRVFKDEPVSREFLRRVIETARYAPTGMNAQNVQWLVIRDREVLSSVSAQVIEWMRWVMKNMPELAENMRLAHYVGLHEAGEDVILRGAPALVVAHAPKENRLALSSSTIALTYLELAAWSMEMGACWAGWVHAAADSYEPLSKTLGLPPGQGCFGAMMVGFPRYAYRRLVSRRPPPITWR
jgi:nitroreductase/ferredoxin